MRRRTSPSRAATSSVSPSARYASVVSAERLSKYSTATLFGAGTLTGRVAVRHGGGAPSGHWAYTLSAEGTDRSTRTTVARRKVTGSPTDRPNLPRSPTPGPEPAGFYPATA